MEQFDNQEDLVAGDELIESETADETDDEPEAENRTPSEPATCVWQT